MNKTSIEWCDYSVNPVRARDKVTGKVGHHCEKVSAGCQNCTVEHFLDESKLESVLSRAQSALIRAISASFPGVRDETF